MKSRNLRPKKDYNIGHWSEPIMSRHSMGTISALPGGS